MIRIGIIFCIGIAIGCASDKPRTADKVLSKSDLETLKHEFAQPSGGSVEMNKTYPIVQGSLPLAHIVTGDSSVQVVDLTSGLRIGGGDAPRRAVVSVDAKNGVTIAGQQVNPGPLPSAHQFGIYVQSNTYLKERQGVGTGPPAATQQAR
jgi:hypothetical protein